MDHHRLFRFPFEESPRFPGESVVLEKRVSFGLRYGSLRLERRWPRKSSTTSKRVGHFVGELIVGMIDNG